MVFYSLMLKFTNIMGQTQTSSNDRDWGQVAFA